MVRSHARHLIKYDSVDTYTPIESENMMKTLTRAERKVKNKLAHKLRREATVNDYREARELGTTITWIEVWSVYESMTNDEVIATLGISDSVVEVSDSVIESPGEMPVKPVRTSKTPRHIEVMAGEYRLAMDSWEAGLEECLRGGRRNGKPANGEQFTDEERDYRDSNPCPQWSDWLQDYSAHKKHDESMVA